MSSNGLRLFLRLGRRRKFAACSRRAISEFWGTRRTSSKKAFTPSIGRVPSMRYEFNYFATWCLRERGPWWRQNKARRADSKIWKTRCVKGGVVADGSSRVAATRKAHASDSDFLDVSGCLPRDAEKRDYGFPLWHPGRCETRVSLLSDTLNACLAS